MATLARVIMTTLDLINISSFMPDVSAHLVGLACGLLLIDEVQALAFSETWDLVPLSAGNSLSWWTKPFSVILFEMQRF